MEHRVPFSSVNHERQNFERSPFSDVLPEICSVLDESKFDQKAVTTEDQMKSLVGIKNKITILHSQYESKIMH